MPVSNSCFLQKIGDYHKKNNNYDTNIKVNKSRPSRSRQSKNLSHKQKTMVALVVLVSLTISVSQAQVNSSIRTAKKNPASVKDDTARAGIVHHNKGLGKGENAARTVFLGERLRRVENVNTYQLRQENLKKIPTLSSPKEQQVKYRNAPANRYFTHYAKQKWKVAETIDSLTRLYTKTMPNILSFAAVQMKQAIFNKTNLQVNPDRIYFHHFTSAENDPTSITGWRHSFSKPVESWSVTECLLKNFPADARDNMDVVDQMTGIYCVPADGANSFGGENQVAIRPSTIAEIVIEQDFYNTYLHKLENYWQTRIQDMMNLYVFLQGLASVNNDVEMHNFYLKAFGIINDADAEVKKYLFDINGYMSTDMIVLTHGYSPALAVYMPRSVNKFKKFNDLLDMRAWFSNACADARQRDEFADYFSIKDRQDGFFYAGVDSWLKRLMDNRDQKVPMEKIWLSQYEVTDTLIEFLSARQKLRAMDDAGCLIKSNAEVRMDMAIRYFSVMDMVLPNPITPIVSLGLGIEKMVNGDTQEVRREGAELVINESINILLMAFCSVVERRLPAYVDLPSVPQPHAEVSLASVSRGMQEEYLSIHSHPLLSQSSGLRGNKLLPKALSGISAIGGEARVEPQELLRIENRKITSSRVGYEKLSLADDRGIYVDKQGNSFIVLVGKTYRLRPTNNHRIFFIGEEMELGLIYSRKRKTWKLIDYHKGKENIFTISCRTRRDGVSLDDKCLHFSTRVKKILDKNNHFGVTVNNPSQDLVFNAARNIYIDESKNIQYLRYGDRFFILEPERRGYAIYGMTPTADKKKLVQVISNEGEELHYLSTRIEQIWETLNVAKISLRPLKMKGRNALNSKEINAIEELKQTSSFYINQVLLNEESAASISYPRWNEWIEQIHNLRSALTKLESHQCTARKLGIIDASDFNKIKADDIFENTGFTIASIKEMSAYQTKLMSEENFFEIEYEFHLIKNGYPINSLARSWSDTKILIPEGCFFKVVKVKDQTVVLTEIERRPAYPTSVQIRKLNYGTPDLAAFRLYRETIHMAELIGSYSKNRKYSAAYIEKYAPVLRDMARQQIDSPAIETYSEAGSDFVNDWLRFGIDRVNELSVKASAEAQVMLQEYANLKDYTDIAYRAVYCRPGVYGSLIQEGDVIMDQGFMSASALPLNSLEWKIGWSKGRASQASDVPVIFIVDRQVGKKIASTHLLIDHIIIRPQTLCQVESIATVLDANGQQIIVVCLGQGERVGAVKDAYSGAITPHRDMI